VLLKTILDTSSGRLIALFVAFFALSGACLAQMPDWVILRDRDGNRIFMDQNGRIFCDGKPDDVLKPVCAEGIDYYLSRGEELIRGHSKPEGLVILKSILALPQDDERIYRARTQASKIVNALVRKEGDRFPALNAQACLLHIRTGEMESLINDHMGYRILARGRITIMKTRIRTMSGSTYHGITAGMALSGAAGTDKADAAYDALLALDAEQLQGEPISIRRAEEHWRNSLGADSFKRTLISTGEHSIAYEFADSKASYSGFEGFYLSGSKVFCLRIIAPENKFRANRTALEKVLKEFRVITAGN
jgi:hypothetical protein